MLSLCSVLHSLLTSSLLGPNILLSTLFSNTLSLHSSLNVSDQVSHPNKTTGKIKVLYILTFKFYKFVPSTFFSSTDVQTGEEKFGVQTVITTLCSELSICSFFYFQRRYGENKHQIPRKRNCYLSTQQDIEVCSGAVR